MTAQSGESLPQPVPVEDPRSSESRSESYCPIRKISKRSQSIELGVFLLLIAPQLLAAFLPHRSEWGFVTSAFAVILRDIGLVSLIFLFLSHSDESPREIGWTFKRGPAYVIFAILTFPLILYAVAIAQKLAIGFGLTASANSRSYFGLHSGAELPLLGILSIVNGTAEEIIFRGYLLLRLTTLTGRVWALILSSAVFGLGHLYQGSASAICIGCLGLVYALICLQSRSLVIPIVWHCLHDFVAILSASSISQ
jgi:membrane protease YdiL (CAAX protease family)